MELIYTNDLCTGCNKCVRGCPVLTANIATQEGYVTVDPDKCIACGECFDVCPHEARDYYDDTDRFFEDLASGKKNFRDTGTGISGKLSQRIPACAGIFKE